jgi:hypothetical protein
MLKDELAKITGIMQNYSELQEEVLNTHHLNQEMQTRVVTLEEELHLTREKVENSEVSEEQYKAEQNRLFVRIE